MPIGAMDRLPDLLERLGAAGASIVQEFPDDCVPLRRGVPAPGWAALARAAPSP